MNKNTRMCQKSFHFIVSLRSALKKRNSEKTFDISAYSAALKKKMYVFHLLTISEKEDDKKKKKNIQERGKGERSLNERGEGDMQ